MKRLYELLSDTERRDVEQSLDPQKAVTPQSVELTKKVRGFFETKVLIEEGSVARWKETEGLKRARMISEIVWRVTCIHEASETAVQGVTNFNLGNSFHMRADLVEGRAVFVVA